MEELFLTSESETAQWNTTLHLHDTTGAERWRATVPLAVLQPPIDQERGRVLLAGFGLASIENGKIILSQRSIQRCLATAGLDGDFALVTGSELRIVSRNGSIRQVFHVREGEVITTPPALAEDGSVWVATNQALYVAR